MSDVVVEKGSAREVDAFLAECWQPYNEEVGIEWDETIHYLAARSDGSLVGAARFIVAGGVGELRQILVRHDRARESIGSRLLEAYEARCRQLGCHKLRLETAEYQARGFYEKHGFVAAHTLENDRFGRSWYLMEKHL